VASESAEHAAQVAPRDHLDAPALALAREELVQLPVGAVVAHDVDLEAVLGEAGGCGLVVAEVRGHEDDAIGFLVDLDEPVEAVDLEQPLAMRPAALSFGGTPRTWPKFARNQRRRCGLAA
jgi:hypothetical protein